MDEELFTFQDPMVRVSEVPRLLKHPFLVRRFINTGYLDPARGKVDSKEHEESC